MWPLFAAGVVSFGAFIALGRPFSISKLDFGLANTITLSRLLLTLALFFVGLASGSGIAIFVIALLVLIADGFDGWAARKRNESSEFGEYFDKETDAFFMLVLCLLAYFQQKAGAWIILPGLLRYLFVVVLVWLKPEIKKEYRSRWARVIYVTMVIALLGVFITPAWFYNPLLAAGTTGIFLSFAHYFRWLFSASNKDLPAPKARIVVRAILALVFLNSLLLLPSLIANFSTSSFFPIPDTSQPIATLTWTRGWYDYFLYFFIRRPNQDIFRFCADAVFLITLLYFWQQRKNTKAIPRIVIVLFMSLLVYEIYDAMVYQFFHRHGIIYEDIQYILNLYYLAIDSLSIDHLFRLILVVTGVVLFTWWLPTLFRAVSRLFELPEFKKWGLIFSACFWPLFIGSLFWYGPADERPTIRSISGKVTQNAVESVQLAKTIARIEQLPVDRVYEEFENVSVAEKPNIYLFMIESYGRVLRDNAYLRANYDSLILEFQQSFSDDGWHMASRYSTAPVSGGLSWLSMNSVLSGLMMRNRTFFTRYISRIQQYPHLIRFLKQQGYYTLTLQPPNKARLGLPIDNHYNFDKTIYFDDLHYAGPAYSIWVIPDQYSLGYTYENYLPQDPAQPYFLFFETATTHAPWTDLPPYVEDWKSLNNKEVKETDPAEDGSLFQLVQNSINNRFSHDTPEAPDLYFESIVYDLNVIRDYILEQASDNSLFIVVGDHQPPLIPSSNYDTPLHVIAKDKSLIERFMPYGFESGMLAQEWSRPDLTHAGLYSMMIDVLTLGDANLTQLPSSRFRPEGVAPSVLTTSD